jgi:hypothetical protein
MTQALTNLARSVSHLLAAVFNDRSAFDRLWRENQAGRDQMERLSVRWHGEWTSEVNNHRGELRCLLRRDSPTQMEARFSAVFARWLRVCYTVLLKTEASNNSLRLNGEADLGMLAGGIYEYEGELNRDRFECTYRCKYDHGIFRLKPLR